jgi:hypothetical protein
MGGSKRKIESEEKLDVNIDAANETLWLVKLPEFMGEALASAEHDDVIGKLKVRKIAATAGKPAGKRTTVELSNDTNKDIPTSYLLQEKTAATDATMLAFSEQYDGENKVGYSLAGSISKTMVLLPDDPKYDKLLRERSVKTYQRREIQVDNNAIFNFNNMNHIVNFKPNEAAMLKKQATEADKANRALKDGTPDEASMNALKLKVFEAFSKAERVKQSDLHAFCSATPSYTNARVKNILEKCAKYHQKGPYKHFWELLPEYRTVEKNETISS